MDHSKIKVHYEHWMVKRFLLKAGFIGITLGRHILLGTSKEETPQKLLRHEVCHAHQWNKDGYLKFPCKYVWDFLKNYFNSGFKWMYSYRMIPYEVEARQAEDNPSYDI